MDLTREIESFGNFITFKVNGKTFALFFFLRPSPLVVYPILQREEDRGKNEIYLIVLYRENFRRHL